MTKEKRLSITIDNRKVEVKPHLTILQAAKEHGIYIPSLCTLEHLPSYGACRLCVVEVDGLRGFPTSCTTPVEDGMVIRTDTGEIRTLRQEVLKLLLSEHPASCLFCTEQGECKQYQGTIRKVGVTTGCRYCPNDERCELQLITERIGLADTSYPVYYRNFPVEKFDPFYDRDYNLCILCGRCVRVCSEVRLNGTLSFKQRGKATTIGPAFDRSHLDAGCEFCGACVTVCPTGALSTKTSKWYGKPDAEVKTTCLYCPVGCELMLQIKHNETIDVLPNYDSPLDRGLLCVKGRFAVPEYVCSSERLSHPQRMTPVGYEDISWDEALDLAAQKLSETRPEDMLFVVSPQLTNEDLFMACHLARGAIGTDEILSPVISDLGEDLVPFLNLTLAASPFDVIDSADTIVAVGFDATYGFTPLGIRIKEAAKGGVALITLNGYGSNLDMLSEEALCFDATKWPSVLDKFMGKTPGNGKGRRSSHKVIVMGEEAIFSRKRGELFEKIMKMKEYFGWNVIVAHPYTNLLGLLSMGAFPGINRGELLRNGSRGTTLTLKKGLLASVNMSKPRKAGYVIGEAQLENMPHCEFLIYQNALPPASSRKPDLILPSSLFSETPGTVVSMEGRVLQVRKATEPYAESRPDWWIMSKISEKISKDALKFRSLSAIQAEIKKQMAGFFDGKSRLEFRKIGARQTDLGASGTRRAGPGTSRKPWQQMYRGIDLQDIVPGMRVIEQRRCHE
ncbi:MAG TPA: molybdopterin-dependent oxidoreductase [Syntrophorhabdaceae bacterium]|nr:molybdopterin-dependent oxidoreductase [Syntrophorhabdaceae bacterium]